MKHHFARALLAPCMIWAATAAVSHAQEGWRVKAPMPIALSGATTGALHERIYVTGGGDASHNPSTATQVYDLATNSWASGVSIPTQIDFAGGAVIGDNFYVLGGCQGQDCRIGVTGLMQAFNRLTNTWTTLASMPTPRYGFGLGVKGGHLFAVGGTSACPPCTPLNVLEEYDPATNAWSTRAPMPTPRENLAAGFANGQLFAVGGADSSGAALSTVEAYFPGANSWSTKASLPSPQNVVGVGVIGNHLYSVSGQTTGGVNVNTVQSYNALTNSWSMAASIPTGRFFPQPVTIDGSLYVAGNGAGNTPISALEKFTP